MATDSQRSGERLPQLNRFWTIATLAIVLGIVVGIRLRLLNVPLERDEGEYAYVGQLMLQGVPPYEQVYTMKWPGTHAAYALIMAVFGQTAAGIHAGLILVNVVSALLVFQLARRAAGDLSAVVATGTYALLSICPHTLGLAAHATHFVVLPALGGIVLVQNLGDRTSAVRVFVAGLLFGLAVLMKQSGAAFGIFAVAWIVWLELSQQNRNWRRLALRLISLALGGLLPLIVTGTILFALGVFDRFWLWTIQYAGAYTSIMTLKQGMKMLALESADIFKGAPALWIVALAGLLLLFCERSLKRSLVFVLGFVCFSFIAVCPGLYFRAHYFLLLLPAAGLLAGVAAGVGSRLMAGMSPRFQPVMLVMLLFCGAGLQMLLKSRDFFFTLPPAHVSLAVYDINPFPESVKIGAYLAEHCPPDGRIAIMGSEPQIYFYSHRKPATGYIYTYPLMEPQPYAEAMQWEMIHEIETADPDYIVYVKIPTSWLTRTASNPMIFDWFTQYQRERFQMVGLVELLSGDQTKYQWSLPETEVEPESGYWLAIFRNKRLSASR